MTAKDLRLRFAEAAETARDALHIPAPVAERIRPSDLALFEPRMAGRRGHFALLAECYLDLAAAQGLAGAVFHQRPWSGPEIPGWQGVFPVPDHFVGTDVRVDARVLDRYTRFHEATIETCLQRAKPRVAVFPTARFLTLPAIARAVANAPSVYSVVIGIMETWPVPDCTDQAVVADAFRRTAETLRAAGKTVQIFAESQAIADDLGDWGFNTLGENPPAVQVAPYPAAARLATGKAEPAQGTPTRFLALGASRPVQNPGPLAEYLLSAALPAGAWSVRLNEQIAAAHLGLPPDELGTRLAARGIDRLPVHLDQQAYDQALLDADVMLLPYGERYTSIGSGIFLECLCAGVIPLVPARSTMRALYQSLGGEAPAFTATTPAGIAEAVDETADRVVQLRENAGLVRDRWLHHPQGPRHWRQRVSELIQSSR